MITNDELEKFRLNFSRCANRDVALSKNAQTPHYRLRNIHPYQLSGFTDTLESFSVSFSIADLK